MKSQRQIIRTRTIHLKESQTSRQQICQSLPKLQENSCKATRHSEHVSPTSRPKYYNHWYIPYDKRFVEQKDHKNFHDELKLNYAQLKEDPLFIYHNLNRPISIHQDPFSKPDKVSIEKQQKYDKTKLFSEMNKSSAVLKLFLEDLVLRKQRVPGFLQNEQLIL